MSPRMMQNMKKIFQTCLCIGALISIWCIITYVMLASINDNNTAINEKKKVRSKKWIHNLDGEKKETVSPRNNFQNLYTSDLYLDLKIAILATTPILLLIIICCYFGKLINAAHRNNSATNRHNVVRYQNDRVMLELENETEDNNDEYNNV